MDLVELIQEHEAELRWQSGVRPCFSTGICESLTCGYGKLDDHGYWEFPLYPAEDYLPQGSKTMEKYDESSTSLEK